MKNKDFGHLLTKENREKENPQAVRDKALDSIRGLSEEYSEYVMDRTRTADELMEFFNKYAFHSEDYDVIYRVKESFNQAVVTVEVRQ